MAVLKQDYSPADRFRNARAPCGPASGHRPSRYAVPAAQNTNPAGNSSLASVAPPFYPARAYGRGPCGTLTASRGGWNNDRM